MMRVWGRFLWRAVVLGLLAGLATAASAAQREALVIAVARYQTVPSLANPVNDTRLVAAALRATGFVVTEVIDPDRTTLMKAVGDFRARTVGSEAAMIYFAGHGVEIGGSNYLLPRDAMTGSEELIKESAVRSTFLGAGVNSASRLRLLVLDACRDNPFAGLGDGSTRSVAATRGLAREEVRNVVTLLATASGQKAADKSAAAPNNSPFARAFAEAVQIKGLDITKLPTRVTTIMATKDQVNQRPDQIGVWPDEDFMLVPGDMRVATSTIIAPQPARPQAVASTAQTIESLGLKVQRDPGSDGIRVVSVAPDGPGASKLFNNDLIMRINGELVDGSVDPATAITSALEGQTAIRLGLKRGQILVNAVLRPEQP